MAFAPAIMAGAMLLQGNAQRNAANYNAAAEQNEQTLSVNQGNAAMGLQLMRNRQALGAQTAAFGSAGVGYGGSSATSRKTSAVNQELDALNTKYRGLVAGYGYGVKAGLDKYAGDQALSGSALLAGSQLLKGYGGGAEGVYA